MQWAYPVTIQYSYAHTRTYTLTHTHTHTQTNVCVSRPKWISHMGMKYVFSEFVLIGWQNDDSPLFGQIQYIVFVNGCVLFGVNVHCTLGIDRHYHSYVIRRSGEVAIYSLSELVDYQPFRAHRLVDGHLYITFRCHIENVSS